jgi:voltage-gated potassium channel Kch
MVREFRWTLAALSAAVLVGGVLFRITPHDELGNQPPSLLMSFYGAWMALLGEPILTLPETWYLSLMDGVYPLIGFVLIGEGVVRLAMLMVSRRQGEKEWMKVMATTYRDHVMLCGLGHLGFRVLEQLLVSRVPVVVIERNEGGRFVDQAKTMKVPVLIRDMKEDQALVDAGIKHARAIILATDDDMANLEVALDARRLNPKVRVCMRLFDQQIAAKITDAFMVDAAFSAAALAAPVVAALALETKVLSTMVIADVAHVTCELKIDGGSELAGRRIDEVERGFSARVLARSVSGDTQCLPAAATVVAVGDTLVVHSALSQLTTLAAAARTRESIG